MLCTKDYPCVKVLIRESDDKHLNNHTLVLYVIYCLSYVRDSESALDVYGIPVGRTFLEARWLAYWLVPLFEFEMHGDGVIAMIDMAKWDF